MYLGNLEVFEEALEAQALKNFNLDLIFHLVALQ